MNYETVARWMVVADWPQVDFYDTYEQAESVAIQRSSETGQSRPVAIIPVMTVKNIA